MRYYRQFPTAIPHLGARSIVLLTLSPLTLAGSLDLHALTTPPAFNLSQDQTLQLKSFGSGHGGGQIASKKCLPVINLSEPAWLAGRIRPVRQKIDLVSLLNCRHRSG